MAISTYLSIVALSVNRLNASIKRHRVANWIKKQTNKHDLFSIYKDISLKKRTQTER